MDQVTARYIVGK